MPVNGSVPELSLVELGVPASEPVLSVTPLTLHVCGL